ncbi:MAG: ParB N-terminal domain-containing protein [Phycisphaerae bacterium]|nr:ParB N-terminal domain-containing protein [Phycisphaerae bacterium]
MKIKVKDIVANPFRDISHYPIDREKVDVLKSTIQETSFWDNLICRKHPSIAGKYQIAYGHHRLIALQELKIELIDIPVIDLSDSDMIKIMADENLDYYKSNPLVVIETVRAAKAFIDGELAKYETWDSAMANRFISHIIDGAKSFSNIKRDGSGQTTILKFLGKHWKQWMIQDALDTIRRETLPASEGGVSKKAIETLPSLEHTSRFKKAAKKYRLSKPAQERLAKEAVKQKISANDFDGFAQKRALGVETPKAKSSEEDKEFIRMEKLLLRIERKSSQLSNDIASFNTTAEALNAKQVRCLQSLFISNTFLTLLPECKKLLKLFGVKGI